MNIDAEDLVRFVYQQVNKVTTALTSNNFSLGVIQNFEQDMPDLLIQFLLEDQSAHLNRRTALDMQTNLLCAKCQHARRMWYNPHIDEKDKKNKVDEVEDLLRFSSLKKAIQKHEQKMHTSLQAALPSDNVQRKKTKM